MSIVLLKIVAITSVDIQVVYPMVLMAKEKVTITSTSGQAVSFDIAFGCAHNITFSDSNHTTGLIALGARPLSFPSQIGSKRFSYCLLPYAIECTYPNITSKISFGNGSEVVGDGVVSTQCL